MKATRRNKTRLKIWLAQQIRLALGTDPRLGVLTGFQPKPDVIYLLSDGGFNGQRWNVHGMPGNARIGFLTCGNRHGKTSIHTIVFVDEDYRIRLVKIARVTGDQHRFVSN